MAVEEEDIESKKTHPLHVKHSCKLYEGVVQQQVTNSVKLSDVKSTGNSDWKCRGNLFLKTLIIKKSQTIHFPVAGESENMELWSVAEQSMTRLCSISRTGE